MGSEGRNRTPVHEIQSLAGTPTSTSDRSRVMESNHDAHYTPAGYSRLTSHSSTRVGVRRGIEPLLRVTSVGAPCATSQWKIRESNPALVPCKGSVRSHAHPPGGAVFRRAPGHRTERPKALPTVNLADRTTTCRLRIVLSEGFEPSTPGLEDLVPSIGESVRPDGLTRPSGRLVPVRSSRVYRDSNPDRLVGSQKCLSVNTTDPRYPRQDSNLR